MRTKVTVLDDYSILVQAVGELPAIRDQYERSPGPKELIILEGAAHAQFIFQTEQGDRLMQEILRFLLAP